MTDPMVTSVIEQWTRSGMKSANIEGFSRGEVAELLSVIDALRARVAELESAPTDAEIGDWAMSFNNQTTCLVRESTDKWIDVRQRAVALMRRAKAAGVPCTAPTPFVDVVLSRPPGFEAARFIELEDSDGRSINLGGCIRRPDGRWVLRIPTAAQPAQVAEDGDALQVWQALGLLLTLAPDVETDATDPLAMAKDVERAVHSRIEETERHCDRLHAQIEPLANVLLQEFDGPTQSESACEMAVRVLREQRQYIVDLELQIEDERIVRGDTKQVDDVAVREEVWRLGGKLVDFRDAGGDPYDVAQSVERVVKTILSWSSGGNVNGG